MIFYTLTTAENVRNNRKLQIDCSLDKKNNREGASATLLHALERLHEKLEKKVEIETILNTFKSLE